VASYASICALVGVSKKPVRDEAGRLVESYPLHRKRRCTYTSGLQLTGISTLCGVLLFAGDADDDSSDDGDAVWLGVIPQVLDAEVDDEVFTERERRRLFFLTGECSSKALSVVARGDVDATSDLSPLLNDLIVFGNDISSE